MLNACLAYNHFFAEYRHQALAQFQVFRDQVKMWGEEIEVMKAGIKPVFDCIGFEPSEGRELLPEYLRPRLILDRCRIAWSDFKEFTHSAAHRAVIHALA